MNKREIKKMATIAKQQRRNGDTMQQEEIEKALEWADKTYISPFLKMLANAIREAHKELADLKEGQHANCVHRLNLRDAQEQLKEAQSKLAEVSGWFNKQVAFSVAETKRAESAETELNQAREELAELRKRDGLIYVEDGKAATERAEEAMSKCEDYQRKLIKAEAALSKSKALLGKVEGFIRIAQDGIERGGANEHLTRATIACTDALMSIAAYESEKSIGGSDKLDEDISKP